MLDQAQAIMEAVQPAIDRYEGFIKEVVVDENSLMPVRAGTTRHENRGAPAGK
jgi:hypothetical protein